MKEGMSEKIHFKIAGQKECETWIEKGRDMGPCVLNFPYDVEGMNHQNRLLKMSFF